MQKEGYTVYTIEASDPEEGNKEGFCGGGGGGGGEGVFSFFFLVGLRCPTRL